MKGREACRDVTAEEQEEELWRETCEMEDREGSAERDVDSMKNFDVVRLSRVLMIWKGLKGNAYEFCDIRKDLGLGMKPR